MIKFIETTIKSTAVMSDNNLYRYQLTRTWASEKLKVTVIMLNPSTANILKTDRTVMNVDNFLIDKNKFGSMTIVNLFAYMTTNPALLSQRDEAYESLNNKYLINAFDESDIIIIAWTRNNFIKEKEKWVDY
ncbi:DUF1643 domain-containing protein [Pseudogracilibacillus auburnensis]|uniref:Uncharacterized protein DUF1643 n=1 Tax=Pseudogracilibacillus auburnensis TaxID=1494959 RepID=A0A2V3VL51_9BACI|nr:DUF1643 domain-containing protein [Pseudogracilibacillus auburnensis]PXW81631.1 uncharacterized protein DUF1643 [Pseudogracilibacillus auburnensis]